MPSIRVTELETYRWWRESEEYDLDWLLRRLRHEEEPNEAMKAGTAFHAALEHAVPTEAKSITHGGYTFYIECDGTIELPIFREREFVKQYGGLTVIGHVDGITGTQITDYKTTSRFDPDRFLEGFQWRYYLDLTGCNSFLWKIFTLREFSRPGPFEAASAYEIVKVEELTQYRYEGLAQDCARLAADFMDFTLQMEQAGISWARPAKSADAVRS